MSESDKWKLVDHGNGDGPVYQRSMSMDELIDRVAAVRRFREWGAQRAKEGRCAWCGDKVSQHEREGSASEMLTCSECSVKLEQRGPRIVCF
jgi:hypothetical protein